jgi:hypothetical protein
MFGDKLQELLVESSQPTTFGGKTEARELQH